MGVTSFLKLRDRHLERGDVNLGVLVVEIGDLQRFAATDFGYLAVLEVDAFLGVFDEGGGVRAEEELAIADSHGERAALPGGDDCVGVVFLNDCYGVCADHLLQSLADRREQRASVGDAHVFYQLRQYFGVGLRMKLASVLYQGVLQQLVVLDGAVVDDRDVAVFAVMRVRVRVRGFAVGGPACVGDADFRVEVLVCAEGFEIAHLPFGLEDVNLAVGSDQRHAGAVVSAVFESVKAFYQNVIDVSVSEVSYYSAHCEWLLL